ncbi:hypothetical protein D7Z54_30940 [Salibacterium salarium]|uniref:Uncharacterized protein n=1 Tax=Salibacterium salarium TaxID=284579 RepID=A0A428MTM7_9BACI|nr:hypothetical protein [Salibacterium salarium]RSL29491.1 hypothetical protein D7Z54_30940 [Salibacterium salarium]
MQLDKDQQDVTFRRAGPVPFIKIETSIDEHATFDSLTNRVLQDVSAHQPADGAGVWVEIILTGKGTLSSYLLDEKNVEEWKEALNEMGAVEVPFFYIHRLVNHTISEDMLNNAGNEQHFLGDMTEAASHLKNNQSELEKEWEELMQHPGARTYLSLSEHEDPISIIDEAQRMLWKMWGKEKANED